jgi:hypothetical protein
MWHNIDFRLLGIVKKLLPQLDEDIETQIVEIRRVLQFASNAVLMRDGSKLVWRHVDSDDTVLKEGDRFLVIKSGYELTLVRDLNSGGK